MKFDNKEVEYSIAFVQELISRYGVLHGMVVGITDDKRYVVPFEFENDDEKDRKCRQARAYFRKVGVKAIVYFSEAWGTYASSLSEIKVRPREDPNRKEGVIISYISATEKVSVSFLIIRSGAQVRLSEPTILINNDFYDRLWGNFFDKPVRSGRPKKYNDDEERAVPED